MKFEQEKHNTPIFRDARASEQNQRERDGVLLSAVEKAIFSPERVSAFKVTADTVHVPEHFRGMRLSRMEDRHMESARNLVQKVFSMNAEHAAADISSIAVKNPLSTIEGNHEYWVLEDKQGSVIGITGMNEVAGDSPDHVWLGWFAVGEELQGTEMGIIMLEYTMQNARMRGKKELYILSDNHPSMASNYKFYHREGCAVVAVLDREGIHVDGSCTLNDKTLQAMYAECEEWIHEDVTWYIRKKQL